MTGNNSIALGKKDTPKVSQDTEDEDEDVEEKKTMLKLELDKFYKEMPITEDTSCGFWIFKGSWLQKLATKKMFVFLYAISGMFLGSSSAYFSGTITTMEKRFKLPSRTMGFILIGNDITQLLGSIVVSYYAGAGHRPRWLGFGISTVVLYCFLNAVPHFLFGPGDDALQLTYEYGSDYQVNISKISTETLKNNHLCNSTAKGCELGEVSSAPVAIWFAAQLIMGVGGTLYYNLGYSYMDDNIKKSKIPGVISLAFFMRTLGPTMGYSLVSIFLKMFIAPGLTPIIDNLDPRWLGAWWIGWLLLATILGLTSSAMAMLPRELPRAAARRQLLWKRKELVEKKEVIQPSIKDMVNAMKRLFKNSIFMYSVLSTVCFVFGFTPYGTFLPKYIETQYRQSSSVASLVTGSIGLVFSALGSLISGIILQRFKPRAKQMALWNVVTGVITVMAVLGYSLIGCSAIDERIPMIKNGEIITNMSCNANCRCDYAKFSPVCSVGSKETYISACHAGCTQQYTGNSGKPVFDNCSCLAMNTSLDDEYYLSPEKYLGGSATSGSCDVNCVRQFVIFLVLICALKFFRSSRKVSNFIVTLRCVEERDKTVSLGIKMTARSLCATIPGPIFFGYIMDSTCLVWGKTCTKKGNCWLYNAALMRNSINYSSAFFMSLGTLFEFLVWLNIKDLNMFDDGKLESEDTNIPNKQTNALLPTTE